MIYLIYHKDETYLLPRDAAGLLAKTMPTILIDWLRGNEIVERERKRLVARNVPELILESHNSLVDNTAWIQIWLPEYLGDSVQFTIQPHQSFILECSEKTNEELLRLAADRISSALGYEVSISENSPFGLNQS